MQQIAAKLGRSYDYIRGQKTDKKPSRLLITLISVAYANELVNLPKYEDPTYTEGKETDPVVVNEDAAKYDNKQDYLKEWMAEKEARLREAEQRATIAEAEKDRLLNILENLAPDKLNQANPSQQNDATGNSDAKKNKN